MENHRRVEKRSALINQARVALASIKKHTIESLLNARDIEESFHSIELGDKNSLLRPYANIGQAFLLLRDVRELNEDPGPLEAEFWKLAKSVEEFHMRHLPNIISQAMERISFKLEIANRVLSEVEASMTLSLEDFEEKAPHVEEFDDLVLSARSDIESALVGLQLLNQNREVTEGFRQALSTFDSKLRERLGEIVKKYSRVWRYRNLTQLDYEDMPRSFWWERVRVDSKGDVVIDDV